MSYGLSICWKTGILKLKTSCGAVLQLNLLFYTNLSSQIALPADAKRKNTKISEEVVIPPNTPVAPSERETPILISSLDEVSVVCGRWLVVGSEKGHERRAKIVRFY